MTNINPSPDQPGRSEFTISSSTREIREKEPGPWELPMKLLNPFTEASDALFGRDKTNSRLAEGDHVGIVFGVWDKVKYNLDQARECITSPERDALERAVASASAEIKARSPKNGLNQDPLESPDDFIPVAELVLEAFYAGGPVSHQVREAREKARVAREAKVAGKNGPSRLLRANMRRY